MRHKEEDQRKSRQCTAPRAVSLGEVEDARGGTMIHGSRCGRDIHSSLLHARIQARSRSLSKGSAQYSGMVRPLLPALAVLGTLWLCGAVGAAPPRFTAEFIVGGSNPAAINAAGSVVGSNFSPMRGWVAPVGSAAVLLPLPAGSASSWAQDINDLGVVVGVVSSYSSPEFFGRAVAWVPNGKGGYTVHELGALPGQAISNATALNNLGDIVGYSSDGTYRTAALFRVGQPVVNLGTAGLFDPQDVNEQRVVVDRSFTSRKLDLNTMAMQDLGTPGAGYLASTASAINEHGQVAGLVIRTTSGSCDREAARHSDELGWEVQSVCGPYNGAQDINDRGDEVMTIQLAPFLRIDGEGTFLIDTLIDAPVGAWTSFTLSALAINNRRQITLSASNAALGLGGCIRLTPIGVPGDIDGDGRVGPQDLAALLAAWGRCSGCAADLDGDGFVGSTDVALLLNAWSADS